MGLSAGGGDERVWVELAKRESQSRYRRLNRNLDLNYTLYSSSSNTLSDINSLEKSEPDFLFAWVSLEPLRIFLEVVVRLMIVNFTKSRSWYIVRALGNKLYLKHVTIT